MSPIVFSLRGQEWAGARLAKELAADIGALSFQQFPDGESYVRGDSNCDGRDAVLYANLYMPNSQIMPLLFAVHAIRVMGARRVILVTPYLPYMRQDARFQPGEVITSRVFAALISRTVDGLVTVDPHLHRFTSLSESYTIPAVAEHAAPTVANWIRQHIDKPLIVAPDSKSDQWVREVASIAAAPHVVLSKIRRADREASITVPPLETWQQHTPILVDDIISTASTMIETITHLTKAGYRSPVCVGIHGLFSGSAYADLQAVGAAAVITCNTIEHSTNVIDVTGLLANGVRDLFEVRPREFRAKEN